MIRQFIVSCSLIFALNSCNNSGSKAETKDSSSVTDHTANHDTGNTIQSADSNLAFINELDREFVMKVAMGNTAEVEAGQLAEQKSSNDGVKDFGAMMVKDHGEAQTNLKNIAASLALSAPDSTDAMHKALKVRLSSLSGKSFDKEYIKAQIKDHQETIVLFEKEISEGSQPAIKNFATNTLPHLRMHLEKAEALK